MRVWWVVVFAFALTAPAQAQGDAPEVPVASPGPFERAGITGSVRAGYWSSTRNLDAESHLGAGMLWLKTSRRLSSRLSFLAEGWTAVRGPFGDGKTTGELREAFVDLRFGRLDIRAGRQIIAWGRADGVNPTDILSGQDFALLAPDDADRRLGTTAARASYYLGDVSVTAVWVPEFRGHAFVLPAPPPGISFIRDDERWPRDQWAVRVEQTGRAVDWSMSYFRGLDTAPDLGVGDGHAPAIRISHHDVRMVGADMAANVGRFGLRAEGGYVNTADRDGRDPFRKNPFFFVVAGTDRTFGGSLNLNVQYLFRYVRKDPGLPASAADLPAVIATQQAVLNNQTRRVQHGASLRIADKWLHDTLEAECAAAVYAQPSGATVRPKISYAVTDRWKVLAGAELFRGESTSAFGVLRPNTAGYLELRWSF